MDTISCEICRDLIPLVLEDAASEGSRRAVEGHIQCCAECRKLYQTELVPERNGFAMEQAFRRIQKVISLGAMVLVIFGMVLCELVLRGASVFFLGAAWLVWRLLRWSSQKQNPAWKRIGAFLAAVLAVVGISWGMNEVFGNPLTKGTAEKEIAGYLQQTYGAGTVELEKISYNMSAGAYDASVQIVEREFTVSWRDGKILYDTFGERE